MQVIRIGRKSVKVSKTVVEQTATGRSYKSVPLGTRTAEIELIIDPSKIPFHKIEKALLSKGRKTVTNGGLVVIRVVPGSECMESATN